MGTTLGVFTGLIVFLASALIGVIATNGANNPGISRYQDSAGAGSTAPGASTLSAGSYTADDLNGDGRLSLAEAAGNAEIVTRFDRADRNRDGKLTKAELNRLAKLPPPKPKTKVTQRSIRRDAATKPAPD
jgi:EF hand